MRVLVTGANGFIGKNLLVHLRQKSFIKEVITFTRDNNIENFSEKLIGIDWIFHLAGINRSQRYDEFVSGNQVLTDQLCSSIKKMGLKIPIVYASSIQATFDNQYGRTKLAAENILLEFKKKNLNPVFIYRLPNVFGKWSRPNYNSVVATFCYNIAREKSIQVNDPDAVIRMVYIDNVINSFIELLEVSLYPDVSKIKPYVDVKPEYQITVGNLVDQINRFKNTRVSLISEPVGIGLIKKLYATYVSYLPPESFTYLVPQNVDARGMFVEMLKTPNAGQFSFFTAHPGITRGGHYHHTKTEKFLVINGKALFRFRHILTGQSYKLFTSGEKSEIVETVPGWTHDITNIGDNELICMLWANEIFDKDKPDTFLSPLD